MWWHPRSTGAASSNLVHIVVKAWGQIFLRNIAGAWFTARKQLWLCWLCLVLNILTSTIRLTASFPMITHFASYCNFWWRETKRVRVITLRIWLRAYTGCGEKWSESPQKETEISPDGGWRCDLILQEPQFLGWLDNPASVRPHIQLDWWTPPSQALCMRKPDALFQSSYLLLKLICLPPASSDPSSLSSIHARHVFVLRIEENIGSQTKLKVHGAVSRGSSSAEAHRSIASDSKTVVRAVTDLGSVHTQYHLPSMILWSYAKLLPRRPRDILPFWLSGMSASAWVTWIIASIWVRRRSAASRLSPNPWERRWFRLVRAHWSNTVMPMEIDTSRSHPPPLWRQDYHLRGPQWKAVFLRLEPRQRPVSRPRWTGQ